MMLQITVTVGTDWAYSVCIFPFAWRIGMRTTRVPVDVASVQIGPIQFSRMKRVSPRWE